MVMVGWRDPRSGVSVGADLGQTLQGLLQGARGIRAAVQPEVEGGIGPRIDAFFNPQQVENIEAVDRITKENPQDFDMLAGLAATGPQRQIPGMTLGGGTTREQPLPNMSVLRAALSIKTKLMQKYGEKSAPQIDAAIRPYVQQGLRQSIMSVKTSQPGKARGEALQQANYDLAMADPSKGLRAIGQAAEVPRQFAARTAATRGVSKIDLLLLAQQGNQNAAQAFMRLGGWSALQAELKQRAMGSTDVLDPRVRAATPEEAQRWLVWMSNVDKPLEGNIGGRMLDRMPAPPPLGGGSSSPNPNPTGKPTITRRQAEKLALKPGYTESSVAEMFNIKD